MEITLRLQRPRPGVQHYVLEHNTIAGIVNSHRSDSASSTITEILLLASIVQTAESLNTVKGAIYV